MSALPVNIVNEQDEIIGETSISEAQKHGYFHRIARVMLEDSDGRVLLQKRVPGKHLWPDAWDNSAAGHVDAGEAYEVAAARELAEEIGVKDVALHEIDYYESHDTFEWRKLNRFNKIYRAVIPADTEFVLQTAEVATVQWFTHDELRALVSDHPEQCSDGLRQVYERHYR